MNEQQIDRDRLRELAEGATPGPWLPRPSYVWTEDLGGIIQNWSEDANAAADMELVATARNTMPALLDMLDQAEAERDRARAQVARVRALLDQYGPDHSPECGWEDCARCVVNEVHRALDGDQ